jgi:anti-anti-sigma regulatory factor
MMIKQEDTWNLTVERGPECLLVTFCGEIVPLPGDLPLGEHLWRLMQHHFTCRIVLDLSVVQRLTGYVVRQLIALARLVYDHNGMMRICGLSDYNQNLLRRHGLRDRLPCYEDREEALVGRHRRCLPQACRDAHSICEQCYW